MALGHFYKRGKKWYGRVDLPPDPVTGKRRQRRFNARTKQAAEEQAAKILASISAGGFAEADAEKITVAEYLDRWLVSVKESVRPSTQKRYSDIVRKHIVSQVGRTQLAKLTPLDVQRLYADRLGIGLSTTTVALIHNILHKALKQAVRWGLLTRNVTEAVDPPREATLEYVTWNEWQVAHFLDIVQEDELSALWRLALLTGMRRGEILGLKWADIDLSRGVLSVKRTLSRGDAGKYTFNPPKTAAGRRSIALPQSLVQSLHKHRVKQLEMIMAHRLTHQDQDLVFANEIGEPISPSTLEYRFKRLTERAGLPKIRFHDIRHSAATIMLASNIHPKVVQERLGHSDVSMTLNRYSHVTMDMQRDAADRLDDIINGTR